MNPSELIAKANSLELALLESGGELTSALEIELQGLHLNVDALSVVCDRLELYGKAWIEKAVNAEKIGKSLLGAQKRLKERLKEEMICFSRKEIAGNEVRFVLSECPKKLVIDENELPQAYLRAVYQPDKERIKGLLLEGKTIKGASLEGGFQLREYPNRKKLLNGD
jgi:hypothetical protein